MLLLAANDLRQTSKDRPALFWMVILPVAFIFLFGSFGGDRGPLRIRLGVNDEDRSFLSQAVVEALRREGFDVAETQLAGADSAAAGAAAASAAAGAPAPPRVLTFPAGLQDSLALGGRAPLDYRVSGEANAEASTVAKLHVQRAIVQTLAQLIEAAPAEAPGGAPAGERAPLVFDAAFEERFTRIQARPRAIQVQAETAGRGRPVPRGMRQSLPATIILFMLVNTSIYGGITLVVEKQERILARIAGLPVTRGEIIGGKLLGGVLIALFQAALLLLAGKLLFRAPLGGSVLGLALVLFGFALVCGSLALFWGAILRRAEQAMVLALVTSLFLGALGGCWWPLEVVPRWMQTVGHLSPTAWAMDGLHAVISFGSGAGAVLVPLLVLLLYAGVFAFLATRWLKFAE
jgi:ABC-type multidrug transport system permease subunit